MTGVVMPCAKSVKIDDGKRSAIGRHRHWSAYDCASSPSTFFSVYILHSPPSSQFFTLGRLCCCAAANLVFLLQHYYAFCPAPVPFPIPPSPPPSIPLGGAVLLPSSSFFLSSSLPSSSSYFPLFFSFLSLSSILSFPIPHSFRCRLEKMADHWTGEREREGAKAGGGTVCLWLGLSGTKGERPTATDLSFLPPPSLWMFFGRKAPKTPISKGTGNGWRKG